MGSPPTPSTAPWPLTYDAVECCSGSDCGQSTSFGDWTSFAACQQGCTQLAGCIGIEYGNDRPDDAHHDQCSANDVCACYLGTGSCADQGSHPGYSYYAKPPAPTPPPTPAPPLMCSSWCAANTNPLSVKVTWDSCNGCAEEASTPRRLGKLRGSIIYSSLLSKGSTVWQGGFCEPYNFHEFGCLPM